MSVENAQSQLDRVLSFFSRVEGKASFLFATNIGMLAIAFTNLTYADLKTWFIVGPLALSLFCAASAIFHVGSVVKPNLQGGKSSTIYFASIAQMSDSQYASEFMSQTDRELEEQILKQVHRNSEILKDKFESVAKSLFWTTISTLPWALYLIISSAQHSEIAKVAGN